MFFQSPQMIVISGPCYSGTSTLASDLAFNLSMPLLDGDKFRTHISGNTYDIPGKITLLDHEHLLLFNNIWLAAKRYRYNVIVVCPLLRRDDREYFRIRARLAGVRLSIVFLNASVRELLYRANNKRHSIGPKLIRAKIEDEIMLMQLPAKNKASTTKIRVEGRLGLKDGLENKCLLPHEYMLEIYLRIALG